MNEIQLSRIDLNLLVTFEALMDAKSVTMAAERLGKTPSAVSHALGRLRQQLGDPLMVKVGGRMQPSPFAEYLIEDVQAILRSIKRVMAPPKTFDPATSDRIFRIAIPTLTKLIAEVTNHVVAQAPNVKIEWLPAHHRVYTALSEGLIDLAHLGGEPHLPDGLIEHVLPPFSVVTFARKGHPASQNWGLEAWHKWPHLQVNVTQSAQLPFTESSRAYGVSRNITSIVADSSGVASILANSDLLGTYPPILLAWDMDVYGLCAMKPPVEFEPVLARFFWSSRLANDPGSLWFRTIVLETYEKLHEFAANKLAGPDLIFAASQG